MCFSAQASFIASALLSVIGVASLKKCKKQQQKLLATVPLLFAAQQALEGIAWLALPNPEQQALATFATYGFLFFAMLLWPVWIPAVLFINEKTAQRKKYMIPSLTCGALFSATLLYFLVTLGAHASIINHHIVYTTGLCKQLIAVGTAIYLLAAIPPFFITKLPNMRLIGFLAALSFLVSHLFYTQALVSVWCFFVALISILIYRSIR